MNENFIKKMKDVLILQKKQLIKNNKDNDIEIDTDGDETDKVQGNLIIEMNNQLNTRNIEKINKIDDALDRIKDNVYGICEDCGEEIPEKRLEANPYIMVCVCCAEDRETDEKQKKRFH